MNHYILVTSKLTYSIIAATRIEKAEARTEGALFLNPAFGLGVEVEVPEVPVVVLVVVAYGFGFPFGTFTLGVGDGEGVGDGVMYEVNVVVEALTFVVAC